MHGLKPYVLEEAERSFCPSCHGHVKRLNDEDLTGPSFYICFKCEFVGQIGVGPVKHIRLTD